MESVYKNILAYLRGGGVLTVTKALQLFHTTELRRVVTTLIRKGHNVSSRWCDGESRDGRKTRYKEYYLVTE